jgi:hypothetical protein
MTSAVKEHVVESKSIRCRPSGKSWEGDTSLIQDSEHR